MEGKKWSGVVSFGWGRGGSGMFLLQIRPDSIMTTKKKQTGEKKVDGVPLYVEHQLCPGTTILNLTSLPPWPLFWTILMYLIVTVKRKQTLKAWHLSLLELKKMFIWQQLIWFNCAFVLGLLIICLCVHSFDWTSRHSQMSRRECLPSGKENAQHHFPQRLVGAAAWRRLKTAGISPGFFPKPQYSWDKTASLPEGLK